MAEQPASALDTSLIGPLEKRKHRYTKWCKGITYCMFKTVKLKCQTYVHRSNPISVAISGFNIL